MDTYIALLRGINVSGRNKLPMKELAGMFAAAGCTDVQTYIQSGNVVFNAEQRLADEIAPAMSDAIRDRFGYEIPVVIRSADELADIVAANPFGGAGVDTKELHVAFLAERPGAASVAELDPQRSPPDRFELIGSEIFLHFPNGVARSKLTNAYFDRVLGTVSTVRNWRTTNKLLEMAGR